MARHLGLMFRGTGSTIGEDYTSRVCQANSDLVEEVHPTFPATMGGLPVANAGAPGDPSMAHACLTAFEDAKRIFSERHSANPQIKVIVGGYSAGAVAAAQVRQWLQQNYPDNYLASFSFGDPTRPSGGCYYQGKPAAGHGISSWRYGDVKDWRHCWLAQPGDMYASVPEGDTGLILGDFYDIVTHFQLSDPIGSLQAVFNAIPHLLVHTGLIGRETTAVPPNVAKALAGFTKQAPSYANGLAQVGGLLGLGSALGIHNPLALLLESLVGLLDGSPDGLAAAINAAVIALQFVGANPPTAPHITYEFGQVWPGQTYLGLAIQHVRDWAHTVQPT